VMIVDTSVWVDVLRDVSGRERAALEEVLGDEELALTRFTQLELLQGARDEREWGLLDSVLATQTFVEARESTWPEAARIYFDLRRSGKTVRSPIDCCIAQLAIENGALILHRDRDFVVIADMRPLRQMWLPAAC
jgi:predicted nucleic acid-binding protein